MSTVNTVNPSNSLPREVQEPHLQEADEGCLCGRTCTKIAQAFCLLPGVNTIVYLVALVFKMLAHCVPESMRSGCCQKLCNADALDYVLFTLPVIGNLLVLRDLCWCDTSAEVVPETAPQSTSQTAPESTLVVSTVTEPVVVESAAVNPLANKASRQPYPGYPERFPVPDDKVSWDVEFEGYAPPSHTAANVIAADRSKHDPGHKDGWADSTDFTAIDFSTRKSYVYGDKGIALDEKGRPRNPVGRTGMEGQGNLGNWGPNHAADPMVLVYDPTTQKLCLVIITREDTGELAIPGGMVDPGEVVSRTLKREFGEEALGLNNPEEAKHLLDSIFGNGRQLYKGYSDDSRNTDNSWMETTVEYFSVSDEIAQQLLPRLKSGDDAVKVQLLPLDPSMKLFASHAHFIREMVVDLVEKKEIAHYAEVEQQLQDFLKASPQ